MKILLKILVFVVSYGIAFALAFYAINNFNGENTPTSVWIIIAFLAIIGFVATASKSESSSSSYYTGGANGQAFFYNMLVVVFKIIFSAIAGVFIAPYKIAGKLSSFISK